MVARTVTTDTRDVSCTVPAARLRLVRLPPKERSLYFHPMASQKRYFVSGCYPGIVTAVAVELQVTLQVALQLDGPQKLPQRGVGTLRRLQHSHSLVIFASLFTTNRLDRNIRQRNTPAFATPFVAPLGLLSTHGGNGTLNAPVGKVLWVP